MDDTDLTSRLHGVDRVTSPDLWARVTVEQGHRKVAGRIKRVMVATSALAVSALVWLLVVEAFNGIQPGPLGPRPNGLVVYADIGPDPESIPFQNMDLFALDPRTGSRWNLTNTPAISEDSPVWSTDGTQVVFQRTTATGEGAAYRVHSDVVVARADGTEQRVLERCGEYCEGKQFSWSPDGRTLAWTGGEPIGGGGFVIALGLFDVSTGEKRILCDSRGCSDPTSAVWSPDGSHIAFSGGGGRGLGPGASPVSLATLDGSIESLTSAPTECDFLAGEGCVFDGAPAWSPDGDRVAFVRSVAGGTTSVMVVDLETDQEEEISSCNAGDQCEQGPVAWSPNGSTVAFVERYDRSLLSIVDTLTKERTEIPFDPEIDYPYGLGWSPDQRELTFLGGPGRQTNLYGVEIATGILRTVARDLGEGGSIAWLPAGTVDTSSLTPVREPAEGSHQPAPTGTVYFVSSNGSNGEDEATEIWSIATDGTDLTRLTNNDGYDEAPSVSADGSLIAFRGYREGLADTQLWVMNADGTEPRVLTRGAGGVGNLAFSPVDDLIAFAWGGDRDNPTGLYVIAADGSGLRLVAEGNVFDPSWSPDGSKIVFADDRYRGDLHLYVADLRSSDVNLVAELEGSQMAPAWSPDGQSIAFEWSSGRGTEIFSIAPDGSGLTEMFEGSDPTWSPDGSWLAFTRFDEGSGPQIWLAKRDGSDARPLTTMEGFIEGTGISGITGSPWWSRHPPPD